MTSSSSLIVISGDGSCVLRCTLSSSDASEISSANAPNLLLLVILLCGGKTTAIVGIALALLSLITSLNTYVATAAFFLI